MLVVHMCCASTGLFLWERWADERARKHTVRGHNVQRGQAGYISIRTSDKKKDSVIVQGAVICREIHTVKHRWATMPN